MLIVRLFFRGLKEFKETTHHAELTNFLSGNKFFIKSALKVHDAKSKFWQKLDEAAFPENYQDGKLIEEQKKKK